MERLRALVACITTVLVLNFAGCGSSEESTGGRQQDSPSGYGTDKPSGQTAGGQEKGIDTSTAGGQNSQKPPSGQQTPSQSPQVLLYGKYSVQIGAYKMQDNAEKVASLARERFGKNVYTLPDKLTDLYKVMVGDFTVKDDARRFRDEMVQRFPSDYKDAWVSELPAK